VDELEALLLRVEHGELGDPLAALAYLAGAGLEIPEGELNAARRRALLLRAAGGDPRREPEIDEPATRLLARELASDERMAELGAALDVLAPRVRGLPLLRDALAYLASDPELAWRLLMLALLAEELGETDTEPAGA
jgi:hypothetical protein